MPPKEFSLFLRIPGWAEGACVAVNGKPAGKDLQAGQYFEIRRLWSAGDRIELVLPMPVQLLEAHPLVEETRNQAAVRRGPIVYCLESLDLPEDVEVADVAISPDCPWRAALTRTSLRRGHGSGGQGESPGRAVAGTTLSIERLRRKQRTIDMRLIPYYAWGNRGDSEMTVWMPLGEVPSRETRCSSSMQGVQTSRRFLQRHGAREHRQPCPEPRSRGRG